MRLKMKLGIYIVALILWIVLCMWTWHSEKAFENNKIKVMYIIAGIIVVGIITLINFNISKLGVSYPNDKMISPVRGILLMIFIPINGFILMPYTSIQIGKLKSDEIKGDVFKRKIIILLVIFFILSIFQCLYFNNIQNGILSIYHR